MLAFYSAHSLWINGGVVLYGIVLTAAHINLRRIQRAAQARREQSGQKGEASAGNAFWVETIRESSFFPLVAGPRSLIPRRTTAANLGRLDSQLPTKPPGGTA
jgi:hypothetical protein